MSQTQAVTEPDELAARPGIYPALLLPFDEPVVVTHEHAGRRYTWPEVRLPKKADLLLTVDHDDRDVVGTAFGFVKAVEGVSCQVKLGRRGEELFRAGHVAISAEVNEDTGEIFGASLCVVGSAGFASARILEPVRGGLHSSDDGGADDPAVAIDPSPLYRPMADMGFVRRMVADLNGPRPEDEVARLRAEFDRRESPSIMREELRLIAACVPMQLWPAHLPSRRKFDEFLAQRETAERREYEAARLTQLLEYQLAAAAVTTEPAPRRSWWRRLKRRLWADPQTTRA